MIEEKMVRNNSHLIITRTTQADPGSEVNQTFNSFNKIWFGFMGSVEYFSIFNNGKCGRSFSIKMIHLKDNFDFI